MVLFRILIVNLLLLLLWETVNWLLFLNPSVTRCGGGGVNEDPVAELYD